MQTPTGLLTLGYCLAWPTVLCFRCDCQLCWLDERFEVNNLSNLNSATLSILFAGICVETLVARQALLSLALCSLNSLFVGFRISLLASTLFLSSKIGSPSSGPPSSGPPLASTLFLNSEIGSPSSGPPSSGPPHCGPRH